MIILEMPELNIKSVHRDCIGKQAKYVWILRDDNEFACIYKCFQWKRLRAFLMFSFIQNVHQTNSEHFMFGVILSLLKHSHFRPDQAHNIPRPAGGQDMDCKVYSTCRWIMISKNNRHAVRTLQTKHLFIYGSHSQIWVCAKKLNHQLSSVSSIENFWNFKSLILANHITTTN